MSVARRSPSYIAPRIPQQTADEDKRGRGGLFGLGFGPDVGLGGITLLKEIGEGLTGLGRMAWNTLPDQLPLQEKGAPSNLSTLAAMGKGIASSVAGTADTINPAYWAAKAAGNEDVFSAGNLTGKLWGEGFEGKDFFEKAGERGVLPALFEDVGNIALAGAATTAPVKGAAKINRAVGNAERAAQLEAVHARMISDPVIRAAQHPYKVTGQAIRERWLKPAAALDEAASGLTRNTPVAGLADKYMKAHGIEDPGVVDPTLRLSDKEGSARARGYEDAPSYDPAAEGDWRALVDETDQQYRFLEDEGFEFEFVDEDPYDLTTPEGEEALLADLEQNRMKVFKTKDGDHPLMTPEQNDKFRAVHDLFGHMELLNDVSRHGEEVAFAAHARMFSPAARRALATETRGQNAWLNFSDANKARRNAGEAPEFGEQKVALIDGLDDTTGLYLDPAKVERAKTSKLTKAAANVERRLQAREEVRLSREKQRIAETAQRRARRSPAVLASVKAAQDLIEETGVNRAEAQRIIGAEIEARMTGVRALIDEYRDRVPEDQLRKIIHRHRGLPDNLSDEARTAITTHIHDAVTEWSKVADQTRAELFASRKGVVGLENLDDDVPTRTRTQQKRYHAALKRLEQAADLEEQIRREKGHLQNRVAHIDDRVGRLGQKIRQNLDAAAESITAFDGARSLAPKVWKTRQAILNTAQEMVAKTAAEGGATFKPHEGRYLKAGDQGFMVGVAPGTMVKVPLEELTPEHIVRVIDAADELFTNGDVTIGTWVDSDGMVHIDPSEHITVRDGDVAAAWTEAVVKAGARQQEAFFSLADGADPAVPLRYRPDIAEHFLEPSKRASLTKFGRQLWKIGEAGAWDQAEMVAAMDLNMRLATKAWERGLVKHPDAYFREILTDLEAAKKRSHSPLALNQLMLGQDLGSPAAREAFLTRLQEVQKNFETEAQWYHRSNQIVHKLTRGVDDISLWNGEKIAASTLVFQLLAATSVQASPQTNFRHTFRAIDWITSAEGKKAAADIAAKVRKVGKGQLSLDEMLEIITDGAAPGKLGGAVEKNPRMAAQPMPPFGQVITSEAMVRTILSGHTMDKWTPQFIDEHFKPAWSDAKTGPANDFDEAFRWIEANQPEFVENRRHLAFEADDPEQGFRNQVVREYYGSDYYTKILSFYDNLANPETSMGVTMDMWMARFFGIHDFTPNTAALGELTSRGSDGTRGAWARAAEQVRALADTASEQLGRKVMPHEMQAVIWSYTNSEIARLRTGHFAAYAEDARGLIDQGGIPEINPITAWIDDAVAPYAEDAPTGVNPRDIRVRQADGSVATESVFFDKEKAAAQRKAAETLRSQWEKKRLEINKLVDAGKLDQAHKVFEKWRQGRHGKLNDEVLSGDFMHIWNDPAYHTPGFVDAARVQERLTGDRLGETMFQKFEDHVLGQFVPKGDEVAGAIRIFESGNLATLAHENGHLLRRMLSKAEMQTAEKHYGVKAGKWTTEAEEAFANDFMRHLTKGGAPQGLDGVFTRVRAALAEIWDGIKATVLGDRVPDEMAAIFDEWLAPEVRASRIPEGEIPGLKLPDNEAGLTIGQRAVRPRAPANASTTDFYHVGRRSAEERARISMLAKRRDVLHAAREKLVKERNDLQELLEAGETRAARRQEKYTTQALNRLSKLAEEQAKPSLSRTPAKWQPLYQAFEDLAKAAEENPALAEALGEIPNTLPEIQALALEKGFNPEHVRQFTNSQVRRLVWGNLRLGLGRDISEMTAGTRSKRSGVLRRAGSVDDSVEAFIAASLEATLERRTNEVITHVERQIARRLPPGAEIPDGWVAWGPTRTKLLTATEVAEDTGKLVETATEDRGLVVIPKAVETALRREAGSYDHGIWEAIGKVTNPWRALVLTLSPGWYARNLFGNVILAQSQGVRLQDWQRAWRSFRSRDELGRWAEVRDADGNLLQEAVHHVAGDTLSHDAGALADTSIVPKPGGIEGLKTSVAEGGKVRGGIGHVRDSLLRANAVVDEFARAAVYHKGKRLNMPDADAWKLASEALVDYGNLSPFERQVVRSVIPFYSWQKGILKVTSKHAVDHPAWASALLALSQLQEEYVADLLGVDAQDVPDYYRHMVGEKNLRSWNPFADTSEILSPEGIARSLNPFIELGVRKGLGAPEFYPQQYRLGLFGNAEPDVNVPSELGDLLGSSPGGRLLGGDTGTFDVMPSQDLDRIRSRIYKSRRQLRGVPNPETQVGQRELGLIP